jgi:protein-S-isoprenylcysteine O-methyltransferase Ste14
MTAERTGVLAFAWFGAALFAASLALFFYSYFVTFGRTAPPGPAAREVAVNAGLFSIFALHHSVLARSGAKAAVSRLVSPALERSVYTWTASLLFIGVCLLWRPVPGELYDLQGPLALIGIAVQAAGIVLTARGSSAIGALELAGVSAALDAPHAAARPALQTSGLYGFVRHPLYFAWVLVVFGAPHMTATRLVFAVVSTAYLALAIPFEERGLIRTFGQDYLDYRRKVRWRMVPGVY